MKKKWISPKAKVQEFVANEYVAACYTVTCDLPPSTVYYEKNGISGYQDEGVTISDEFLFGGQGCGGTHVAHGLPSELTNNACGERLEDKSVYSGFYFEGTFDGGQGNKHFATSWIVNANAS